MPGLLLEACRMKRELVLEVVEVEMRVRHMEPLWGRRKRGIADLEDILVVVVVVVVVGVADGTIACNVIPSSTTCSSDTSILDPPKPPLPRHLSLRQAEFFRFIPW